MTNNKSSPSFQGRKTHPVSPMPATAQMWPSRLWKGHVMVRGDTWHYTEGKPGLWGTWFCQDTMPQVVTRCVYTTPKHGQQKQDAQSIMIWTPFLCGNQVLDVTKHLLFVSSGVVGGAFRAHKPSTSDLRTLLCERNGKSQEVWSPLCFKQGVVSLHAQDDRQGKASSGPQSTLCEDPGTLSGSHRQLWPGWPSLWVFVLTEPYLCPRQCLHSLSCSSQEAVAERGPALSPSPIHVPMTKTIGPQVPQIKSRPAAGQGSRTKG